MLADFSVHSFTDLGITGWLVLFMAVFIVISFYLLLTRAKDIPSPDGNKEVHFFSREFGFIAAMTILCLSTVVTGLGTSAPNPVLTNMLYFRDEYEAHIKDKKCPAGVCKPLFHYEIDPDACTGCGVCKRKCPQDAITGEKKKPHMLNQDTCIKCGICYDACKFNSIVIK